MNRLVAVAVLAGWSSVAGADPVVLRLATPAPDGTAWAREGKAFARDIEQQTRGQVKIKFLLGGIAGDELTTFERMKRGQLDVIASGGALCQRLSPSMRVLRVLGLFQSRDESAYVSGRLRSLFDDELKQAGVINVGEVGVGPDVFFSRAPIHSMAELRQAKLWVWDLDEMYRKQLAAIGMQVVPVPLEGAGHAYDDRRTGGFVGVPTAALAFQWSAQVKYLTDLRAGFLRGCFLMSTQSWDALSVDQQESLRTAYAKLLARLEEVGRAQDDALLGGLFERQGVHGVAANETFRSEFYDATRQMREKLGEQLVPRALLSRVLSMLADYRAEHGTSAQNR